MEHSDILDHPAISGRYLFPQRRRIRDPFLVPVDGAELACFRQIVDPDHYSIVHFHGNGEAVSDYVPEVPDALADLGVNCLLVEYRQYGDSTGQAQLSAMLGDGQQVVAAAGLAPEKAIAFGRSIGSLYAIELAHRMPQLAGLILESGIADPAERFLEYADLSRANVDPQQILTAVKQRFNHRKKLSAFKNPLLIMHTEHDGLIDVSHARRNYKWSGSARKTLHVFTAGNHNTIMSCNREEYFHIVGQFIKSLP